MTVQSKLLRLQAGLHGQQSRHRAAGIELQIAAGGPVVRLPEHFQKATPGIDTSRGILYFIHHHNQSPLLWNESVPEEDHRSPGTRGMIQQK